MIDPRFAPTSPADIVRLVADGEISRGRALELLRPHLLVWHRGFPPKSGMYLVDLGDREFCVTPYTVPGDEGVDTWGDKRGAGWTCLAGSHARVRAWAVVPSSDGAELQKPLSAA